MYPIHIIYISTHLDTHLHSRDAAQMLFEEINRMAASEKTILDFADVFYMSRSFADQFHKEMQECATKGLIVEITNASSHIAAILQAVAQTQNATNRQRPILPYIKFDNEQDFENYLLAI